MFPCGLCMEPGRSVGHMDISVSGDSVIVELQGITQSLSKPWKSPFKNYYLIPIFNFQKNVFDVTVLFEDKEMKNILPPLICRVTPVWFLSFLSQHIFIYSSLRHGGHTDLVVHDFSSPFSPHLILLILQLWTGCPFFRGALPAVPARSVSEPRPYCHAIAQPGSGQGSILL